MRRALIGITLASAVFVSADLGLTTRTPAAEPAAVVAPAPLNTLTEAEKAAGWQLLFDGKTLDNWRGIKKPAAPAGWQIIDGTIVRVKRSGDLITKEKYESFDLILDWRITPAGNSGVMYHVTEEEPSAGHTGPECQILDNIKGEDPQRAGWCYALYQPPIDPKTGKPLDTTKPVGEWNTMRVLVNGTHVEHWMNGVKYVEYELWSDDWHARVAKTKFANWTHWGKAKTGYIALQDHNGEVAFRNIKIKVLSSTTRP